jgi:choline monooxygenase
MANRLSRKLAGFDPSLPIEQARTIPASWYHDRAIAEAERRSVFGATWQLAARLEQVAAPGDYCTADLAGEPVVVVRGDDGVLRAFSNVCRHRAARVMEQAEGCATRLRCRYHGWTYDLAGRLRGTPEFDGVADFRREDQGLTPLRVATWGPFVWVHLDAEPPTLDQTLEPLTRRIGHLGLAALRWVERREYRLECNWKVFVDNYLDGGYHVNTVHPALAGVLDYAHYRTDLDGEISVQTSPIQAVDAPIGSVRSGENAYYAWVFPNTMVNVYHGVMDTNQVYPLGPDRCRVLFDFYFAETDGPDSARTIAESIALADQIQQEDIGICEEVQRGLASRFYETGRFCVRREASVYQFHRLLADRLRAIAGAESEVVSDR